MRKIVKNLKIWRKASSELKRIARKRYNYIKRYIEENEHMIDDKTKEKLTKVMGKYNFIVNMTYLYIV